MPNDNLQFRIATQEDAPQLQQMVQSAFRAEDSRPSWTADMDLSLRFHIDVEEVITQITKPDGAILIATDSNGALVGSIEISKRSADLARFSMLAVDQHHQRGGIGRQILAYAEDYCRQAWGVEKLGLNALSTRQELILWYIRCGFQKTGELTPFPYDRFNGMALPDDLCFVELEKDLKTIPVAAEAV
jgi:ribosomal protein S18 acetylase RimI-like enzyme